MKNYIILIFILSYLQFSCGNKKSEEDTPSENFKNIIVIPERKRSDIYKSEPISSETKNSTYNLARGNDITLDALLESAEYKLNIRQIKYKDAKVFIYDYETKIEDTLEIYADSLRFNSASLKKISAKKINYNDKSYLIEKFYYSYVGEFDIISANLFFVENYGVIVQRQVSQTQGVVTYNVGLDYLRNYILQDTIFYKFEIPKD